MVLYLNKYFHSMKYGQIPDGVMNVLFVSPIFDIRRCSEHEFSLFLSMQQTKQEMCTVCVPQARIDDVIIEVMSLQFTTLACPRRHGGYFVCLIYIY